jgi:hypothetical protein
MNEYDLVQRVKSEVELTSIEENTLFALFGELLLNSSYLEVEAWLELILLVMKKANKEHTHEFPTGPNEKNPHQG